MKIRNGFVSNSSSSSFVVAFPREPKNAIDVLTMMFGEDGLSGSIGLDWSYEDDPPLSHAEIAAAVWRDIQQSGPQKSESDDVHRTFNAQALDIAYDANCDWDTCYAEAEILATRKKIAWLKDNQDAVIYCFEYYDNEGSFGAIMEHGDVFRNLPHIRGPHH